MEIRKYQNKDFNQMMNLHRKVLMKENVYRKNGYIFWKEEMIDGCKCIWHRKKLTGINC